MHRTPQPPSTTAVKCAAQLRQVALLHFADGDNAELLAACDLAEIHGLLSGAACPGPARDDAGSVYSLPDGTSKADLLA